MSHDPEVIKFVFDVLTTLFVFFISFLIIIYLIDKRKQVSQKP